MPRQGSSTSTDKGGASTPKEKGLMVSMWARALGEKSNILLENDEREGVLTLAATEVWLRSLRQSFLETSRYTPSPTSSRPPVSMPAIHFSSLAAPDGSLSLFEVDCKYGATALAVKASVVRRFAEEYGASASVRRKAWDDLGVTWVPLDHAREKVFLNVKECLKRKKELRELAREEGNKYRAEKQKKREAEAEIDAMMVEVVRKEAKEGGSGATIKGKGKGSKTNSQDLPTPAPSSLESSPEPALKKRKREKNPLTGRGGLLDSREPSPATSSFSPAPSPSPSLIDSFGRLLDSTPTPSPTVERASFLDDLEFINSGAFNTAKAPTSAIRRDVQLASASPAPDKQPPPPPPPTAAPTPSTLPASIEAPLPTLASKPFSVLPPPAPAARTSASLHPFQPLATAAETLAASSKLAELTLLRSAYARAQSEGGAAFVSLDVEMWERDKSVLLEFGWSVVEFTKKKKEGKGKGKGGGVKVRREDQHAIVKENLWRRNGRWSPDARDHFDFGKSLVLPQQTLYNLLSALFSTLSSHHPVYLIFHDPRADLEALQQLGFDSKHDFESELLRSAAAGAKGGEGKVWIADTQKLFSAWMGRKTQISLDRACQTVEVPTRRLHNAGNDAHYTLDLFERLMDPARILPSSHPLLLEIDEKAALAESKRLARRAEQMEARRVQGLAGWLEGKEGKEGEEMKEMKEKKAEGRKREEAEQRGVVRGNGERFPSDRRRGRA